MLKRVICPKCSYVQEIDSTSHSFTICDNCNHKWYSMQNSIYKDKQSVKVIMGTANHYKYTIDTYKNKDVIYPFFAMDNNYVEFSKVKNAKELKVEDLLPLNAPHKTALSVSHTAKNKLIADEVCKTSDNAISQKIQPDETLKANMLNNLATANSKSQLDNIANKPIIKKNSTLERIKRFFGFGKTKVLPPSDSLKLKAKQIVPAQQDNFKKLDKIANRNFDTFNPSFKHNHHHTPKILSSSLDMKKSIPNEAKNINHALAQNKLNDEPHESALIIKQADEHNSSLSLASIHQDRRNSITNSPAHALEPAVAKQLSNNQHEQLLLKDKALKNNSLNEQKSRQPLERSKSRTSLNIKKAERTDKQVVATKLKRDTLDATIAQSEDSKNSNILKPESVVKAPRDSFKNSTREQKDNISKSHHQDSTMQIKKDTSQLANVASLQPLEVKPSKNKHDNNSHISSKAEDRLFFEERRDSANAKIAPSNPKTDYSLTLEAQELVAASNADYIVKPPMPERLSNASNTLKQDDDNLKNENLLIGNKMKRNSDKSYYNSTARTPREKNSREEQKTAKEVTDNELQQDVHADSADNSSFKEEVSRNKDVMYINEDNGSVFYEQFVSSEQKDKMKHHMVKSTKSTQEDLLERNKKRQELLEKQQERQNKRSLQAKAVEAKHNQHDNLDVKREDANREDVKREDTKIAISNDSSNSNLRVSASSSSDVLNKAPVRNLAQPRSEASNQLSNQDKGKQNSYREVRPFTFSAKSQMKDSLKPTNSLSLEGNTIVENFEKVNAELLDKNKNKVIDKVNPHNHSLDNDANLAVPVKEDKQVSQFKSENVRPANQSITNEDIALKIKRSFANVKDTPYDNQALNKDVSLADSSAKLKAKSLQLPQAEDKVDITDLQQSMSEDIDSFSAKQFLLQKIQEEDEEYLDFLSTKMGSLKSEDIKQALIKKKIEIKNREEESIATPQKDILVDKAYTASHLAKDMKNKVGSFKLPVGYVILAIFVIIILVGFYLFSVPRITIHHKSTTQQRVSGIPTIDDKSVANFKSLNGEVSSDNLIGSSKLDKATSSNQKEVTTPQKNKKHSIEIVNVEPGQLNAKNIKKNIKDKNSKKALETDKSYSSSLLASTLKSILSTRQSLSNVFNDIKVYQVDSNWQIESDSQFKTAVTLYNSSKAKPYSIQELEVIFVNASGKSVSSRKLTPNRTINAGEFIKINIIFPDIPKTVADSYVFIRKTKVIK